MKSGKKRKRQQEECEIIDWNPCPVCGSEIISEMRIDPNLLIHVACPQCGAETNGFATWEAAISAWNSGLAEKVERVEMEDAPVS